MKIPYNWLKEFINTKLPPKETARVLTTSYHALDKPLYEQAGDTVMDLEDRGNRADVSGIIGIARDLGALTGEKLIQPKLGAIPPTDNNKFPVKISVHSDKVTRWRCVVYKNIKVSESPDWVKKRLEAYGIEPKNNVVDITNYVMLELGMPLHAFDLAKVDEINLRMARKCETLVTFEGTTLTFDENDLLAADSKKPLTLTTAIGGQESGVTDKTTDVLIEAGLYNQPTVRRSALRLNVRNESANRLGKYLHPEFCELAIARVVELMNEVLKAKPENVSYDYYPHVHKEVATTLSAERLATLSGEDISLDIAEKILESLEFKVTKKSTHELSVVVPYFRTDVSMEDDLIEEVLRIKGYNTIPSYLPKSAPPKKLSFPLLELEDLVKDSFVQIGFNEVISHQIIDVGDLKGIGYLDATSEEQLVRLENSWNNELNILRPTFITNLLKYYQSYKKHKVSDIRLFETGKVYIKNPAKNGFEK